MKISHYLKITSTYIFDWKQFKELPLQGKMLLLTNQVALLALVIAFFNMEFSEYSIFIRDLISAVVKPWWLPAHGGMLLQKQWLMENRLQLG